MSRWARTQPWLSGLAAPSSSGKKVRPAKGRYSYRGGVAVYEDNDAWRTAAGVAVGVAAGIAIGTLLAKPPAQAAPVVVSSTTYLYENGTFYTKAMHEGQVVYQVVEPPPGAIIPTLPAGCTSSRGHIAVRNDPLQEGGVGLPGRRAEVISGKRERSWAALPAVVLAVVATTQIVLTQVTMLSPWKGGGFGMFSTLDGRPFRYVRMFVRAPERSEELAVPPSLEELAASAEILPSDTSARATGPCGRRAGAQARPTGRRGADSTCGAWSSPQARWPRAITCCAGTSSVRLRSWITSSGPTGPIDIALRLTLVGLLLRPMGPWFVRAPLLLLSMLGLMSGAWLRAPALWLALATLVAVRVVVEWPLPDNHIYLLAYWCLASRWRFGSPIRRDNWLAAAACCSASCSRSRCSGRRCCRPTIAMAASSR